MTWSLAGGLVQLRREVDAAFPGRSTVSDGTLGDLAHQARTSDHNPDGRGVVRAWDCTRDVVDGIDVAERLAEWLRAKRDPRVKYVIFRRRIFSSDIAPWTWRPYDGANPHEHHCHVSVKPYPVGDADRPWGFTKEDDVPLTGADVDKVVDGLLGRTITTGWQEDGSYDSAKPLTIPLSKVFAGDRGASLHAAAGVEALAGRLAAIEQQIADVAQMLRSLVPPAPPELPPGVPTSVRRPS